MKKKIALGLLVAVSTVSLTACEPKIEYVEKIVEVEKEVIKEVEVEKEVIKEVDMTPSPVATGKVIDWIPNSPDANISLELDIKNASSDSLKVICDDDLLENKLDYKYEEGELVVYGTYLDEKEVELGEHKLLIVTEHGSTTLNFNVVLSPVGTTIPTKTEQGINMSQVANYKPTTPIADAPSILITEIGADNGEYCYIEVFNNSAEEINLKGHRIVIGDVSAASKQSLLGESGILSQPIGMASSAYIYQDYKIPALSSAIIWIVASSPWNYVSADKSMAETDDALSHLFGDAQENLSIEKFRTMYSLAENVLVFPVRCQYSLMNATSGWNQETGLGAVVTKADSNRFKGLNSATANRMIQIQYVDQESHFTTNLASAPEGATYYRYEMDVINREEDVYVNGVLDTTKMTLAGGRQSVNGLIFRKVYYNANNELVGYGTAETIDLYNAEKPGTLEALKDCTTEVVSAYIYGKVEQGSEGYSLAKWGAFNSLEYTLPAAGSKTMKFIPRAEQHNLGEIYQSGDFKDLILASIGTYVADCGLQAIEVPVDPAYSTAYLTSYTNTVNVTGWFNFGAIKPE